MVRGWSEWWVDGKQRRVWYGVLVKVGVSCRDMVWWGGVGEVCRGVTCGQGHCATRCMLLILMLQSLSDTQTPNSWKLEQKTKTIYIVGCNWGRGYPISQIIWLIITAFHHLPQKFHARKLKRSARRCWLPLVGGKYAQWTLNMLCSLPFAPFVVSFSSPFLEMSTTTI